METCADCGKPILPNQGSYYRKHPTADIGETFHSSCGDAMGTKAKDAEIDRLRGLILDACKVFEHYDLPEHAFHYRREVGGLAFAKQAAATKRSM